jgi:hypothetical protein
LKGPADQLNTRSGGGEPGQRVPFPVTAVAAELDPQRVPVVVDVQLDSQRSVKGLGRVLDDVVGTCLEFWREIPRTVLATQRQPSGSASAFALYDPVECRAQPEFVERWRTHADRELAQVDERVARDMAHFFKLRARELLVEVAFEHVQPKQYRRHRLRCLVV